MIPATNLVQTLNGHVHIVGARVIRGDDVVEHGRNLCRRYSGKTSEYIGHNQGNSPMLRVPGKAMFLLKTNYDTWSQGGNSLPNLLHQAWSLLNPPLDNFTGCRKPFAPGLPPLISRLFVFRHRNAPRMRRGCSVCTTEQPTRRARDGTRPLELGRAHLTQTARGQVAGKIPAALAVRYRDDSGAGPTGRKRQQRTDQHFIVGVCPDKHQCASPNNGINNVHIGNATIPLRLTPYPLRPDVSTFA